MILAALAPRAPPGPGRERRRFAVLPFENTGSYGQDKEVFEALELGLAAMLAGALDRSPGRGRGPARPQLDEVMRQARASAGAAGGCAPRAAQVGKATGARYAVTGSFADFYGKFRINARVVDAETGEILKVVSNDDPKLQDRAQLAAIVSGGRADHLRRRPAALPCRLARRRRSPPTRSPPTAAACCTRAGATAPRRASSTRAR